MIVPVQEIFSDVQAEALYEQLRGVLCKYRRTLQSDPAPAGAVHAGPGDPQGRRADSVGTRAWIVPMDAADREWKFSVPMEVILPAAMTLYADLCGWTLARAHGRPVTASPWLPTSAAPQSSTKRSLTSPKPTPPRTSATTPRSKPLARTARLNPPPRSNAASIVVVAFAMFVLGRRRWRKRQPGAFAGTIQLTAPVLGRDTHDRRTDRPGSAGC
jgi:hypothetical protein